jgi:hypothetical protein
VTVPSSAIWFGSLVSTDVAHSFSSLANESKLFMPTPSKRRWRTGVYLLSAFTPERKRLSQWWADHCDWAPTSYCAAINIEVQANNSSVQQLTSDKGLKRAGTILAKCQRIERWAFRVRRSHRQHSAMRSTPGLSRSSLPWLQHTALDIVRRLKATPIHDLERYMRCKDCSQVRGYPYKQSHLVALRTTKITTSDPASHWWPGER